MPYLLSWTGTTSLPKAVLSTQRQFLSNRLNTSIGEFRRFRKIYLSKRVLITSCSFSPHRKCTSSPSTRSGSTSAGSKCRTTSYPDRSSKFPSSSIFWSPRSEADSLWKLLDDSPFPRHGMSFLPFNRYRTRSEDCPDAQVRPFESRSPRRRRRGPRSRRSTSPRHADVRAVGSEEETQD